MKTPLERKMSTETNKKLIEKVFNEAMNERNFDILDQIVAPGYVNHGIPNWKTGADGLKEILKQFLYAYPDMKITIKHVIGEDNMVTTSGYWNGTNKGSFMGAPASGKEVKIAYIDLWKIEDGKCAENWVQMDMIGLMMQTGAMPMPA